MAVQTIDIQVVTPLTSELPYCYKEYKVPLYINGINTTPTGLTAVASDTSMVNIKNSDTNISKSRLVFDLKENTSFSPRQCTITVTATSAETSKSITINIWQKGFEITPIWKDTDYNLSTLNDSVEYEITSDGNIIYSGKAYKLPSEQDIIIININKICSSSLSSTFDNAFMGNTKYHFVPSHKRFYLNVTDELTNAYNFYNSYSYDNLSVNNNDCVNLSFPINNIIDTRQYFVNSFFYPLVKAGSGVYPYLRYSLSADMGSNYSNSIDVSTNEQCVITDKYINNTGTLTIKYNGFSTSGDTMTYQVKDTCCKYCLYYVNAYGGWDSFLINGNDKRTDDVTRYNYIRAVNNTTTNHSTVNYFNTYKPTYRLYTHYLTDDEASRMFHLLESNTVYLHNLEENTVIPVTINTKSVEYKTFTNNGKQKFYYEIEVVGDEKIRR